MNDSTTRKLKAQRIRDMAKMVAEFRERPEYNEASLAISEGIRDTR
jgi:hypothetical protein